VHMFYHMKPDVGEWIGAHSDRGFDQFQSIPTGVPQIIFPQSLPSDSVDDLKFFYPWLSICMYMVGQVSSRPVI